MLKNGNYSVILSMDSLVILFLMFGSTFAQELSNGDLLQDHNTQVIPKKYIPYLVVFLLAANLSVIALLWMRFMDRVQQTGRRSRFKVLPSYLTPLVRVVVEKEDGEKGVRFFNFTSSEVNRFNLVHTVESFLPNLKPYYGVGETVGPKTKYPRTRVLSYSTQMTFLAFRPPPVRIYSDGKKHSFDIRSIGTHEIKYHALKHFKTRVIPPQTH